MRRFLTYGMLACSLSVCIAAAGPKGRLKAVPVTLEGIQPDKIAFESSEDGSKYIALRLHLDNAAAVRAHISGMHLAAGEKLFIYSADGASVFGPFEGAGPVQSGEFWSQAIAGGDLIVEFQAGTSVAADLPFAIDGLESAETAAVATPAEESVRESRVSLYQGIPIAHEVVDGIAIYEGDIVLGKADELATALPGAKTAGKSAVSITGKQYRWPNGTMPYVISDNVPNPERIASAINHWNTAMAGTVRMIPRTKESNYITFVYSSNSGICSSYVGMQGYGSQMVYVGDYCSTGNMIHEIGHCWGLWHEHTREDRDKYVTINWANIVGGQSYNFTQNISNGDDLGAYDYNSVMHYNATSFSSNGLPTIDTIPAGIPIGQRAALSTGDMAAIRLLYPSTALILNPKPAPAPAAPVTVAVTITSNPSGSSINVDGSGYTTPAAFDWLPGSIHTVAANDAVINGTRGTFASWSDGGAQSHTVTTPSATTMLKADYAIAYSVQAKAWPNGTATVSPSSADGFYAAGTALNLSANPALGYCFTNWTGLIAGTPNRATLSATKPYDLQANFQPGGITLSAFILYPRAAGGDLTLGVNATSGCTWRVYTTASWITVASAQSGTGSGTVTISVAPNTTGVARNAQVTVGYKNVVISQSAN
jgi:hypothetical protein